MKISLSKEDQQKIIFGVLLLGALLYGYSEMLIGPTKKKKIVAQAAIDKLDPQIAAAKTQIQKLDSLKVKGPVAVETVEQVKAMIPEGAPVAWFPSRVTEFFKQNGIEKITVRMSHEYPEKELKQFRKLTWTVEVPKINLITFCAVLSKLENEEPLIEATVMGVEPNADGPEFQNVFLSIANLANL